ncbi:MAG: NUDIX hydrolase [Proteobacteria bacterium]|nr:NUDIX hydrolase [Pseudomonadota bacterium]
MTSKASDDSPLFRWALEIQSISQNGLTFVKCAYDKERYLQLQNIAAQMLEACSCTPIDKILDLFGAESGYSTPKIDVRGAIFKKDSVLLVKERSDQRWTLPGGWADSGYSPAYCVQKEILEESGYQARVKKLVAVFDKLKHDHPSEWPHAYKFFFLCEITGGTATTSIETSAVDFFPMSQLPPLSIQRVTPAQIKRCHEHYLQFDLPTDFD